jgi:ribokinase
MFHTFAGGKGANQAVAAARLGALVTMIGKVGSDSFGSDLKENLQNSGVDVSAVSIVPGASGVALITTDAKGENAITVVSGANGSLTPADVEKNISLIRNAGILLTQLEIPLDTVECLATIAGREGIQLIVDPAPAQSLPSSLLKNVDWLTPNESETCSLLGYGPTQTADRDLRALANLLLELGSRNVILKLGRRGSYVAMSDGSRLFVPTYNVNAVDTTAAGDAFNGAFAAGLLQGKPPVESARFASAVAAISVTRKGAQPSMPTLDDVNHFLRANTAIDADDIDSSLSDGANARSS